MSIPRCGFPALLVAIAALGLLLPTSSGAAVSKWVDANGVTRYRIEPDDSVTRSVRRLAPSGAARSATPRNAAGLPARSARPVLGISPAEPTPRPDAALSLEAQILRDREAIKSMISGGTLSGAELARDPRMRSIAERLPGLQSEQQELQREQRN